LDGAATLVVNYFEGHSYLTSIFVRNDEDAPIPKTFAATLQSPTGKIGRATSSANSVVQALTDHGMKRRDADVAADMFPGAIPQIVDAFM